MKNKFKKLKRRLKESKGFNNQSTEERYFDWKLNKKGIPFLTFQRADIAIQDLEKGIGSVHSIEDIVDKDLRDIIFGE